VDTPDELREVVGEGLREIARWLDRERLLKELKATDLPDVVRELAAEVKATVQSQDACRWTPGSTTCETSMRPAGASA
jgi:hypothetical protein